ncbi:putative DNA-directed RNA polymerase [Rosa chinensis]|uniref:DNA-directed RNA polymerase subunit n=1 Tax=Rosa chinensis TaxID=74649 RepID=A0A2P6QQ81_ROSCH|nr:DNA-directed RNA polymerase V subunit 7 [Rosa chinensis]PRQ36332.1 putative DNA-directed RNA polymerase [Rosa chinensis]
MFLKVELPWNVVIPPANLVAKGLMLKKSISLRLLKGFAANKATKDHGYFLAITTVESIGEGKVRRSGDVVYPVVFSCITFKLFRGEIIEGVVHHVLRNGVLMNCGPVENIFLYKDLMPDYRYVPGENPIFLNEKTGSKIVKDVLVRCVVLGTKWLEEEREFRGLVSLEGDYLGPVS